jgi:hypothetical protein
METFNKSDLSDVTKTLQSIMDELWAINKRENDRIETDKTNIHSQKESSTDNDSKLKEIFGRAMKIFENEAAYRNTFSKGGSYNKRNSQSQTKDSKSNSNIKSNGFEKWERIQKNRWDFGMLEPLKTQDVSIIVQEKFDYSVDDECQVYAWVILRNGHRRRAAMKGRIWYLLPDPPKASWDLDIRYGDISRELWEIIFYTIQPFICQQACHLIGLFGNEQQRDHFSELWPDLFHEFEFLYWVVLASYTGRCYRDTVNLCRTKASYYLTMGRALYNIMMLITIEKKNDSGLSKETWATILTIFGQSFLQVFQEYSAIFQPASNFLYTGYIADTV